MRKIFWQLLIILAVALVCLPLIVAAGTFDEDLLLEPEFTINGETYTYSDIPHDRADDLNYVNIPLILDGFASPVTVGMEDNNPVVDGTRWVVSGHNCGGLDGSRYYLDADLELHENLELDYDETAEIGGVIYDEAATVSGLVEVEVNTPGCYKLSMYSHDEDTDTYNVNNNIYLVVTEGENTLVPSFSIDPEHGSVEVFAVTNAGNTILAGQNVSLINTTESQADIAGISWSAYWTAEIGSDEGSSAVTVSGANQNTAVLNANNPGFYRVKMELTNVNGVKFTKEELIISHKAENYFHNVIFQRDDEFVTEQDFDSFLAAVTEIDDVEVRDLYELALAECSYADGRTTCSEAAQAAFADYDAGLTFDNVACTHYPDLGGYSAGDEFCRAAATIKEIEAFLGDAEDSDTPGHLRPDSEINRIEMCTVLNRSVIGPGNRIVPATVTDAETVYPDLRGYADSDWRKRNAKVCSQFTGNEDGTFRPANSIQLDEALKVLSLLFLDSVADDNRNNIGQYCTNVSVDAWYAPYLAYAHSEGHLEGIANACSPGRYVTRGEVVLIMYRMFIAYAYIQAP